MKRWGGTICVVILLFAGLIVTPAMGSMLKAGITENTTLYEPELTGEIISVEFMDCTGRIPVKHTFEVPESEWNTLREKLRDIRRSSSSSEESMNAQFAVLKEYNFISEDVTYQTLSNKAYEKFSKAKYNRFFDLIQSTPIDNVIINAMCSINFELTNGTTLVLGLNSFVNLIGFDIISFHKGYAPEGIDARGQSADPGEYFGSMFGFLGYWYGTQTVTGIYTDLEVAGFTILTFWFPSPI